MNLHDVIAAVVRIPSERKLRRNLSLVQLVAESGFSEHADNIGVAEIRNALLAEPHRVEEWHLYSGDKRTSSGWWLMQYGGEYVVGYHPGVGKRGKESRESFGDSATACATFIVREVAGISQSSASR